MRIKSLIRRMTPSFLHPLARRILRARRKFIDLVFRDLPAEHLSANDGRSMQVIQGNDELLLARVEGVSILASRHDPRHWVSILDANGVDVRSRIVKNFGEYTIRSVGFYRYADPALPCAAAQHCRDLSVWNVVGDNLRLREYHAAVTSCFQSVPIEAMRYYDNLKEYYQQYEKSLPDGYRLKYDLLFSSVSGFDELADFLDRDFERHAALIHVVTPCRGNAFPVTQSNNFMAEFIRRAYEKSLFLFVVRNGARNYKRLDRMQSGEMQDINAFIISPLEELTVP